MSRLHDASELNGRKHEFHAEAEVLSGELHLPLRQKIEPQTTAHLYSKGGYISEHSEPYRLEGVVSFNKAYSQVAGNRSTKEGHGWATLTTTVVEQLNVLEILTADRVVGQIIVDHPAEGYVPQISFLGTRYENLRIAGHPLDVELYLRLLGDKPAEDGAYSTHGPVVERVREQYGAILGRQDLPAKVRDEYNQLSSTLGASESFKCSLVKRITGSFPGTVFGHILIIPDFGTVSLADVTVTHEDYNQRGVPKKTTVGLTMLGLKLGCAIDGILPIGSGNSNGTTHP